MVLTSFALHLLCLFALQFCQSLFSCDIIPLREEDSFVFTYYLGLRKT
jgi:hypothetical protein